MSFPRAGKSPHGGFRKSHMSEWPDRTSSQPLSGNSNQLPRRSGSRRSSYTGSVPVKHDMPPLPDEQEAELKTAFEKEVKPTLWCESIGKAVHPSEVSALCDGRQLQSLTAAASEARHLLTAAVPVIASRQLHVHQACKDLDGQVKRSQQLLDQTQQTICLAFEELHAQLNERRNQLLQQAREKGAELINSVGGLREQIVALGQNLEEANATATAVIGCGDEELLGTLGPLSGSILSLCEQADNTCWTEEAHVGVGFNDDSDLSQIEAEPTSIVTTVHCVDPGGFRVWEKLMFSGSPELVVQARDVYELFDFGAGGWKWTGDSPLVVEGGTIARKKDSLGDSWSVALADCTLSRGQQHWEIQVLQYSNSDHVTSALSDRMEVQEMAIRGLSELSASGLSAVKRAGVWGQVRVAADQKTILHAEVIVGVCPSNCSSRDAIKSGVGLLLRSGGLLVHQSKVEPYGEPFAQGDSVGVTLDFISKELRFTRNGRSLGIALGKDAFASLGDEITPFIALSMPGSCVRLSVGPAPCDDSNQVYAQLRAKCRFNKD